MSRETVRIPWLSTLGSPGRLVRASFLPFVLSKGSLPIASTTEATSRSPNVGFSLAERTHSIQESSGSGVLFGCVTRAYRLDLRPSQLVLSCGTKCGSRVDRPRKMTLPARLPVSVRIRPIGQERSYPLLPTMTWMYHIGMQNLFLLLKSCSGWKIRHRKLWNELQRRRKTHRRRKCAINLRNYCKQSPSMIISHTSHLSVLKANYDNTTHCKQYLLVQGGRDIPLPWFKAIFWRYFKFRR